MQEVDGQNDRCHRQDVSVEEEALERSRITCRCVLNHGCREEALALCVLFMEAGSNKNNDTRRKYGQNERGRPFTTLSDWIQGQKWMAYIQIR